MDQAHERALAQQQQGVDTGERPSSPDRNGTAAHPRIKVEEGYFEYRL
jgi:hypothetical protein